MRSEDEILKDMFVAKRVGKPVAQLFEELQKQRCSQRKGQNKKPQQPTGSDVFLVALLPCPLLILFVLVIAAVVKTLSGGL